MLIHSSKIWSFKYNLLVFYFLSLHIHIFKHDVLCVFSTRFPSLPHNFINNFNSMIIGLFHAWKLGHLWHILFYRLWSCCYSYWLTYFNHWWHVYEENKKTVMQIVGLQKYSNMHFNFHATVVSALHVYLSIKWGYVSILLLLLDYLNPFCQVIFL